MRVEVGIYGVPSRYLRSLEYAYSSRTMEHVTQSFRAYAGLSVLRDPMCSLGRDSDIYPSRLYSALCHNPLIVVQAESRVMYRVPTYWRIPPAYVHSLPACLHNRSDVTLRIDQALITHHPAAPVK